MDRIQNLQKTDVNHLPMVEGGGEAAAQDENTENKERLKFYWDKLDPYYKFNGNDECFKDFADRAREEVLKYKH